MSRTQSRVAPSIAANNTATPANDVFYGTSGNDTLRLDAGDDTAFGFEGQDNFFDLSTGNDTMYGGGGNDNFWLGLGNDTVYGGTGTDTVLYTNSDALVALDLQSGFALNHGIDTLNSVENAHGTVWNDVLLGSTASNTFYGNGGDDKIEGRAGHDILVGGAGRDTILGGSQNDLLYGGEGRDTMRGGTGHDVLTGGGDWDTLTGDLGADIFDYVGQPWQNGFDTITDFRHGIDTIRVSAIDARPDRAGNQAFTFDSSPDGSTEEFFDSLSDDWGGLVYDTPGPIINADHGEIEFRHSGNHTYVYLAQGDGLTAATLRLEGHVTLTASDFIL